MPNPVLTPEGRLVMAREQAAITQSEMAQRLGVSLRTVRNYESGSWMPPATYHAWADLCDCDYDWLIGRVPTASEPTKLERRRRAKRTLVLSDQGIAENRWTADDHDAQDRIHFEVIAHAA